MLVFPVNTCRRRRGCSIAPQWPRLTARLRGQWAEGCCPAESGQPICCEDGLDDDSIGYLVDLLVCAHFSTSVFTFWAILSSFPIFQSPLSFLPVPFPSFLLKVALLYAAKGSGTVIGWNSNLTNRVIRSIIQPFFFYSWRFGNHCCLLRNDCPPGVTVADSK